jgi:putative ABC transport system permease protein
VIRQGMVVVLLGIALGLAGSFGLTRLIATLLYGVTATDMLTFVAAPAILMMIALFACWLPALRASRVDPLAALRYE